MRVLLQHLALIKKGLQNAKSPALTGLFFWSVYLQRFWARGLKSNGTKMYAKEKLATLTVYKIDL